MPRHGLHIPNINQEAVAVSPMLDLQGYSTGPRCDNGNALAERLGDFDLEAFPYRELECDAGLREEGVEKLVGGRKADNGDGGARKDGGDGWGREEGNNLVVY